MSDHESRRDPFAPAVWIAVMAAGTLVMWNPIESRLDLQTPDRALALLVGFGAATAGAVAALDGERSLSARAALAATGLAVAAGAWVLFPWIGATALLDRVREPLESLVMAIDAIGWIGLVASAIGIFATVNLLRRRR